MSLRRTIFLVLVCTVLATVALEVVLDVAIDNLAGADEALVDGEPGTTETAGSPGSSLGQLVAANRLLFDLIDVPLMILLSLVLGWLLARRIAAPLKRLTAATRRLTGTGVPEPVAVPAGNDELSELARSFNAMSLALAGFVERERAFTRYASHELRTPLSAMRLQIERAELGLTSAQETLPVLKRNIAQLEEILAALLSLARAPDEATEHRLLAPLLQDSLASFPVEERTRLTVRDAAPKSLKVTHARLLQQALTNLVDNALRHGSGRTTVEVEAVGSSVTLRVQDEGPGVDGSDLSHLTEPFYRGGGGRDPDSDRNPSGAGVDSGGFGLGLAFVAFVAKALGGELRLDNSSGGLLAVLTLPIVAPA